MDEAKFDNLCSHYKDSCEIHQETVKQRDFLFYGLLVIFAVFTLQFSAMKTVANIVNQSVNKLAGITLGNNADFITTLLFLLLFGISTRYFQKVIEIEHQFDYLNFLENELNTFYSPSHVFTREGKSYQFPLFSQWVGVLYKLVFPSLLITCVFARIFVEILAKWKPGLGINCWLDIFCAVLVVVTTVFYMLKIHSEGIKKIIQTC